MTLADNDRVISLKAVAAKTSLSRTTIWRLWAKKKTFPAPIQLSDNRVGWPESAVNAWLSRRARTSQGEAA